MNRLTRNQKSDNLQIDEIAVDATLENTEKQATTEAPLPLDATEPINKKSEKLKKTTGQMVKRNGIVVMLPPEEVEQEQQQSDVEDLSIDKKNDVVTLEVDSEYAEVQHVIDTESEITSRLQASEVREENKKRADQAKAETKPRKVGDTIVTDSPAVIESSRQDIELFEQLEKLEKQQNEN